MYQVKRCNIKYIENETIEFVKGNKWQGKDLLLEGRIWLTLLLMRKRRGVMI